MSTKGNKTTDKILDSTIELIFQKGIEATSISDIITKIGMSKGSLYFHFPDKQTLVSKALSRYEKSFFEFISASLQGNSPGEKLENFLESVKRMHKSKNYSGGCIFGNTALEMADKNDSLSQKVKNVFDRWISMLSSIINDAQKTGEIRSDLNSKILAGFIVSSVEGGIMLSRLEKKGEPLSQTISALKIMICLKQKRQ
ncbi:transcriptional regulator, TetR family [Flexistipes sinusarabici DSM 4947]|uniref:Transcriptional regulator, TetR family n=1 Tax=Flexistipes sinusarabici (strain ATCC 49648 / DSM 4947 / MAS 10) TaxID=717231 RepID=F8E9L4_FLESM|nr:TetR/AcrR family transcriptional regulator [Flexistipes sinusarabici]AEI15343.1 transcriptional regulator, TetR family [Flexistipes sinusarabici DSM 4947]